MHNISYILNLRTQIANGKNDSKDETTFTIGGGGKRNSTSHFITI
jgi:hypothetical protein